MTADPDEILRQMEAAVLPEAPTRAPVLVKASDIVPTAVEWLWPSYLPRGKLVILDGDPELGKSTITLDLAARVSTGRTMPDGAPTIAGGVVLLSAEDGAGDTVRPRLEAAGADLERVVLLKAIRDTAGQDVGVTLPDHLAELRVAIEQVHAVLVVVDTFTAYLSGGVNTHIDHDVRRTLAPLAQLAEETGATSVLIRHLNKTAGGNPLYRGGGSIAIIGAARMGLLVARDPDASEDDDARRVFAVIKSNLAPKPPALAFTLESAGNGVARVRWGGATTHRAAALVSQIAADEDRGALDEAKDFLRDFLTIPRTAPEARRAAREAGVSERTLLRAKAALGVRSEKAAGPGGGWVWKMAKQPAPPSVGNVGNVGHLPSQTTSYEHPSRQGCQPGNDGNLGQPPLGAGDAWEPDAARPSLMVTSLGSGLYLVDGGKEPHEVRLAGDAATCDCADHLYRRHDCKHIVAARRESNA